MAVPGSLALAALLAATPDLHALPTESMLFMALVVATALVGGLLPAVLGAVLSSLLLNVLFVPPTGTLTIADPENALALAVFLLTGVAVATVVDRAARRTEQATRARAEANALAVLSHTLLHTGDNPAELLQKVCEVFAMTGAAILRRTDGAGRPRPSSATPRAPPTAGTPGHRVLRRRRGSPRAPPRRGRPAPDVGLRRALRGGPRAPRGPGRVPARG